MVTNTAIGNSAAILNWDRYLHRGNTSGTGSLEDTQKSFCLNFQKLNTCILHLTNLSK